MHIAKRGLRALGIAESFSGRERSILGGVVMRKDLRVDGMACTHVTVGGMDATDAVLRLIADLRRRDINLLLISGCVIAWYNIIDPEEIARRTSLPVIIVTYEESEGLEGDICRHFPGDAGRLSAYRRLGPRTPVPLHTGHTVYLRVSGISAADAARLCNDFTLEGKTPEPVRLAQLLARAVLRYSGSRHPLSG
ncbi:MAG: DUF99 family protein [Methanomicrobiales archaeon]|nr:DUF99 family protein [Methanomicrobiales archaeon]MDI6876535.1 DUF99 family protein [Methanomicrobiales archaeon]